MNKVISFLTYIFGSFTRYVLGLSIILLFIVGLAYQFPLLRYFFEKDGPKIELLSSLDGFGTTPQKLHFKVTDNKSGIELIRVRVDQSRLNKEIHKLNVPLNTATQEVSLLVDGKKEGFKPGNIRITIEAFDRSLKSNGGKLILDTPVRFDKPQIELLTSQHNTVRGGMEFVIYRVMSEGFVQSGIRLASKEFIGFPLHFLDKDFESIKGVYFSFYVIPFDAYQKVQNKHISPVVFARNSVGNESTESFYYRLQNQRQRTWKYEVENLDETRFIHDELDEYLSKLTYIEQRFWNEKLIKPNGNQLSPEIGDKLEVVDRQGRQIKLQNNLISFRHSNDIVTSNTGKVVSIVEGQGFKKIAIIEHGFGLTSVYSNLGQLNISKNQELGVSERIGKGSLLPQTNENGFEYGLFYQGIATRPMEWWDQNWVRDHVLKKLTEVKKRLGVDAPSVKSEDLQSNTTDQIIRPVIRNLNDIDSAGSHIAADQFEVNKGNPDLSRNNIQDSDDSEDYESGRDF